MRCPTGGGRGYGPTHSQSLQKHFLGVPGLWVVAPHALLDPGDLLRQAIFDIDDPVLFVEHKIGYGERLRAAPPDYEAVRLADAASPFPTLWLKPRGPADGLLMCYGGMTQPALDAAALLREREKLDLGLVVVSQLAPTPAAHLDAILSEAAPAAVVTVEEAPAEGGWGAEMIATVEQARDRRGLAPIAYRRVGAKNTPIPSARDLEDEALPQVDDIVAAVLDCFCAYPGGAWPGLDTGVATGYAGKDMSQTKERAPMDERIRAIMAEVLRLPADRIGADAAMGAVPNWDSTAHMRMMIALEDEFGIDLDEFRMVEMTSFAKIASVVEELRSGRPHSGSR